jgi:hypothetical protein
VKGEVVSLSRKFPTKEMAMHTDEKEEKENYTKSLKQNRENVSI